jgi:hypothetical protein
VLELNWRVLADCVRKKLEQSGLRASRAGRSARSGCRDNDAEGDSQSGEEVDVLKERALGRRETLLPIKVDRVDERAERRVLEHVGEADAEDGVGNLVVEDSLSLILQYRGPQGQTHILTDSGERDRSLRTFQARETSSIAASVPRHSFWAGLSLLLRKSPANMPTWPMMSR